jgi:1,4-dihydroxy-6-naphthoate synthase
MTTDLRLGISPCPNDVFIFSGLLLGQVDTGDLSFGDVVFADIETLNERAQVGDLDVVKISYANHARCAHTYDLLECGGALGRGVGPLLLRNGPGGLDSDAPVLVPGAFTTANFLLDYFVSGRPLQKRFLPFDALYDELRRTPGAQGVVIHEKRFTYARDGLTLVRDLGEHWEEATGFAIPLGAIAIRRALGLNARSKP